ncbi:unnamed protein product [marine sediment metagenome]|uniref:Uncharacterized protein n=1 Tax=marine sediment metagenome TaxID=412755 RepID=X1M2P1_9ZZZZ
MNPSMSYEGIRKYYAGEWNHCYSKDLDDGSELVVLSSVKDDKVYRFRVRDFYGPAEEVLEYTETTVSPFAHILERQAEAKCLISSKGGNDVS